MIKKLRNHPYAPKCEQDEGGKKTKHKIIQAECSIRGDSTPALYRTPRVQIMTYIPATLIETFRNILYSRQTNTGIETHTVQD
jgi:hypothetical protein